MDYYRFLLPLSMAVLVASTAPVAAADAAVDAGERMLATMSVVGVAGSEDFVDFGFAD